MQPALSIAESLAYSTIRIECQYKNGTAGTGTGFFFAFHHDQQSSTYVPVIITNKHVIRNSEIGKLTFTKFDKDGRPTDNDHEVYSSSNFERLWTFHPDSDVDLCAMPIGPFLKHHQSNGLNLAFNPLNSSIIASNQTGIANDLDAIEDIIMVGYPNGLWDEINNQPIFRKGITATHPLKNYLGKKEFVIDAACFPGSSGSPIFIYNPGGYTTKTGNNVFMGSRLIFLGVLYAGPQMTVTGEIIVTDIPTVQTPLAVSKTMINLGYAIKAERVMELENLIPSGK
jgi:V8-like Glu-specific endopeptidase